MFQWAFVGSGPPPTPAVPDSMIGYSPTRVLWRETYVTSEQIRKKKLREDEEFIIFLK